MVSPDKILVVLLGFIILAADTEETQVIVEAVLHQGTEEICAVLFPLLMAVPA